MTFPRIGISLGDPGGIGPEVTLRALFESGPLPSASYILFGSREILTAEMKALGRTADFRPWKDDGLSRESGVFLRELAGPEGKIKKGSPEAALGRASFSWFEEAVAAARSGRLDAIVTAPVSKLSWSLAGVPWRGHTEYLAQYYSDAVMSFWSDQMTVALLSHHLPLREALARITPEGLARFFKIVYDGTENKAGRERVEILVAGLNPHAGENGLLGTEERDIIEPAVAEARRAGLPVRGPIPPDVVFRQAIGRPERIVAAMYHDQGLIPFKLTAFEDGVNVTLGLPFIRTSPDHGTAFDIAGMTPADPRSMTQALRLAVALSGSAPTGL